MDNWAWVSPGARMSEGQNLESLVAQIIEVAKEAARVEFSDGP